MWRGSFPAFWVSVLGAAFLWSSLVVGDDWNDCDQFAYLRRRGQDVSFNNNIWNNGSEGQQCIWVNGDASAFSVTWQWATGPETNPVHSFPYVRFLSDYLPARLWDLETLRINGTWAMHPTDNSSASAESANVVANAAIDMFLDADPEIAPTPDADFEVMVWIGQFGGAFPFGDRMTPVQVVQQGDRNVTFHLYKGTKQNERQIVLSWVMENDFLTTFDLDILAFIRALQDGGLIPPNLSVGVIEFGQETFQSNQSVTFSAQQYNMELTTNSTAGTTGPSTSAALPGPRPNPTGGSGTPAPSGARMLGGCGWVMMVIMVVGSLWNL